MLLSPEGIFITVSILTLVFLGILFYFKVIQPEKIKNKQKEFINQMCKQNEIVLNNMKKCNCVSCRSALYHHNKQIENKNHREYLNRNLNIVPCEIKQCKTKTGKTIYHNDVTNRKTNKKHPWDDGYIYTPDGLLIGYKPNNTRHKDITLNVNRSRNRQRDLKTGRFIGKNQKKQKLKFRW